VRRGREDLLSFSYQNRKIYINESHNLEEEEIFINTSTMKHPRGGFDWEKVMRGIFA